MIADGSVALPPPPSIGFDMAEVCAGGWYGVLSSGSNSSYAAMLVWDGPAPPSLGPPPIAGLMPRLISKGFRVSFSAFFTGGDSVSSLPVGS